MDDVELLEEAYQIVHSSDPDAWRVLWEAWVAKARKQEKTYEECIALICEATRKTVECD